MSYGSKLLFTGVDLQINKSNRYGLVGANGAGKSTFFRVLNGEETSIMGDINVPKNCRIGCLKQDQFLYENVSIINTVIAGKKILSDAINERDALILKGECTEEECYRLADLEHVIIDHDGYNAEFVASELLTGLGIAPQYHYEPLSVLSGGYKIRVLLAQSLFNDPDILLLDEPTNHLDINSIYWLEDYLKSNFKGSLIFISHDVAFLNNLSTHILDIDYGEIRLYHGNYNKFVQEKEQIIAQKITEKKFVEKKIAVMQSFVDKFGASAARARQAQSRAKQIDKIELPDIQKSSRIYPNFIFKAKRASGKLVLKTKDIWKTYGEKNILRKVGFTVDRGDKLIIVGPNGTGKSTLLKILLGNIIADKGEYEWGYESQISYFSQDHHDLLNESLSALQWIHKYFSHRTEYEIRTVLGQVLFTSDEANKNILNLSGGEGARLLLAKLILEESNILVLDEPTNHLDIESKESLKKSLKNYSGTLILVTHDRDFATSIATRIIAISDKSIIDFKGSYKEYLDKYGKDYLTQLKT
jgi:ATPase subunit of ABC transporter with duplicated ATPase domains